MSCGYQVFVCLTHSQFGSWVELRDFGAASHILSALFLQVIAINNKFPGPTINVTTNNNVAVNVRNKLDESLLIHWYVDFLFSFNSS